MIKPKALDLLDRARESAVGSVVEKAYVLLEVKPLLHCRTCRRRQSVVVSRHAGKEEERKRGRETHQTEEDRRWSIRGAEETEWVAGCNGRRFV